MSAAAQTPSPRRPQPRPVARPAPRAAASRPVISRAAAAPRPPAPPDGGEPDSALVPTGFVASLDLEAIRELESPMGTGFFDTLSRISAYGVEEGARPSDRPAELRGYPADALKVVASIATHYLYAGGYRLAEVLFEGLCAVAPDEPYHWLGLGLGCDRQNRTAEAARAYRTAAEKAPGDARPLVNLAELEVEAGRTREAQRLLARAVTLAERAGDRALHGKAKMMLERLAGAPGAEGGTP